MPPRFRRYRVGGEHVQQEGPGAIECDQTAFSKAIVVWASQHGSYHYNDWSHAVRIIVDSPLMDLIMLNSIMLDLITLSSIMLDSIMLDSMILDSIILELRKA